MKVVWSKNAQKAFQRYDELSRRRLRDRIEKLALGFEGFDLKRLRGKTGKVYRIRIGSIRVTVEWGAGGNCVVLDIVDRKDAY